MKYLKNLQIAQAIIFLTIPLILQLVNKGVRLNSISAYVNFTPVAFASMLSLAGFLFITNGFVNRNRWANIYVGGALLFVVWLNHLEFPVLHYTAASIFFLGSIFNMIFFSSNKQRWFKVVTGLGILFGMAGHFIFGWYSLFYAEWIGMFPISLHFILEEIGKID